VNFYNVLVSSNRYHGSEFLTYGGDQKFQPGSIVVVPLRQQPVLAIVTGKAAKPAFATKPITRLVSDTPLPAGSLGLLEWLRDYYPAPLGSITSQFVPSSLLGKTVAEVPANTVNNAKKLPELTKEQKDVLKSVEKSRQKTFLLHGDTGTGKTRVYIELAKKQLEMNKSVLVLTPEIGLTPQLVREFETVFGRRVIVMHSNLTDKERRSAWLKILESKQPVIAIGPRSALFAPFTSLGLVVVDEAHDSAYKQEQAPHYQAARVASKLAEIHGATLIFGTGTPAVTEYYIARAKKTPILRMQELAVRTQAKPDIELIPGRDRTHFSRHPYLSNELLDSIENALKSGEQSLVFLNRRGTARLVMCQNCGWQAVCPTCDLPLTYHGDKHIMRCHTCGFKQAAVSTCPICNSADIIFKSIGTKSLADALTQLFPKARVQRFDTDNAKAERLEEHYHQISSGDIDILVGTQILAKGLDLPKLAVVGVVAADSSLYFPDYTAEERTYQLLNQVIGRVGRGHRAGKAIIQTYSPESPAIKAALNKDWDSFYKSQLVEREKFMFPPFCYLLKLSCARKTPKGAETAATTLLKKLKDLRLPVQIIGPAPAFHEKVRSNYVWQLVIKAKSRGELLKIINELPAGWSYDLDPTNLL
jgi:primosomal protein N' (replication factor Y)